MNFYNRTTKFTIEEFKTLPRNKDGDIIDLSSAFIWIKNNQIKLLSEDDSSRFEEYSEEMQILMAQAKAEFS